ncbi:MAG: site-specific integrase [Candidatus Diapherotrites archaeon]|nr:site-specific integrase [Candidatus Diapherotrites archaeon]
MIKTESQLSNYFSGFEEQIGKHNAQLIIAFAEKHRATVTEPSLQRISTVCIRLKSIAKWLNKPLDRLTEADLIRLNTAMRDKGMKSSADYRQCLKHFFKLTDKKRFYDLIESEYLRNVKKKGTDQLVDAEEFWSQSQCNDYLMESLNRSKRHGAFAAIWLSCGMRPHEIMGLHKADLELDGQSLVVKVRSGKTGKRTIVLNGNEGTGVFRYVEPYLDTLKDNEKLFSLTYKAVEKCHHNICEKIGLPEGKSRKLYMSRKRTLTRWYNEFGLVKAAKMCGHVQGGRAMKHYLDMTDEELKENKRPERLENKVCPNPNCKQVNEPLSGLCSKCSSPLDRERFDELIKSSLDELVETKIALAIVKLQNEALKLKTQ